MSHLFCIGLCPRHYFINQRFKISMMLIIKIFTHQEVNNTCFSFPLLLPINARKTQTSNVMLGGHIEMYQEVYTFLQGKFIQ